MQQRLIMVTNFEHKILLKDLLEVPAIHTQKKKKTTLMIHIVLMGYASLSFFLFFFFQCILIHVLE